MLLGLLLGRLLLNEHVGEVKGQEDGPLRTVVRSQYLDLFNWNASLVVLTGAIEQTSPPLVHTVVPGDECVSFTGLLVEVVVGGSASKHLTFTTFELSQYLIVSLPAHHDLTMNVFNIHILAAMSGISSHQTRLVGDSGLYIVHSCCRRSLLE